MKYNLRLTDNDGDDLVLDAITSKADLEAGAVAFIKTSEPGYLLTVDALRQLCNVAEQFLEDPPEWLPERIENTKSTIGIRRAAALALAKETLGPGMHGPDRLIKLADWLLGGPDTTRP